MPKRQNEISRGKRKADTSHQPANKRQRQLEDCFEVDKPVSIDNEENSIPEDGKKVEEVETSINRGRRNEGKGGKPGAKAERKVEKAQSSLKQFFSAPP